MISRMRAALDAFRQPDRFRSAAFFDAAGGGNRLANWNAPSSNFANIVTPEHLRQRARDAYRNNGWARRAVELWITDAIGASGIKPQFRGANRKAAQQLWDAWSDQADFTGRFDLYGLEQLIARTFLVDGEVLMRLILDPTAAVPLRLQALPCEFLDGSRVDDRTLNGIEYDAAGRRVAYWLFTKHPAMAPNMKSVRVPADEILHVFEPIQLGAERGVTRLAPALVPLRELQEFAEAELVKQKTAALFCGVVTSADGTNPLNPNGTLPSMEPGSLIELTGSQTVEFSEPPDVGSFDPFVRAQLRSVASALGVPYELLSGDLSAVTFASGRHGLLAYRRVLESLQHNVLVAQLMRPVLDKWLRLAIAMGLLPGEPSDYPVRWIGPVLAALDPKAEVSAQVMRVRAGFTSRSEVIAMDGWDAEQIDEEIAADNARVDRLGNVYDSDPRKVTAQGQEQQSAQEQANV